MSIWKSLQINSSLAGRHQRLVLLLSLAALAGILWFALLTRSAVPDFRQFTAGPERKAAFLEFMQPLIEAENERVRQDRERLLAIIADGDPGFLDRRWLASLAKGYALDEADPELLDNLLRRVDTVPLSLALAQSAKESGWGSSRFARNGNNLFGEWCFDEGCGMVPRARSEGRRHEVRTFSSPRESVASYLENINTHAKYLAFRLERARLRAQGRPLSGTVLADRLSQYSERRDAYVEELQQLIRVNDLESFNDNIGG